MGIIIAAIVVLIALGWAISTTNGFKRKEIKVQEGLSGIEVALTKRYDMLTKLMNTAKGYMAHEKDLFTQIIELRQGMSVREMGEASDKMTELTGRLFAVAENYPELRSAEVFTQLQHGVRDAEEHLQAARRLYNANVTAYNTAIVMVPASLLAGARKPLEFFEAEEAKRADVTMSF